MFGHVNSLFVARFLEYAHRLDRVLSIGIGSDTAHDGEPVAAGLLFIEGTYPDEGHCIHFGKVADYYVQVLGVGRYQRWEHEAETGTAPESHPGDGEPLSGREI